MTRKVSIFQLGDLHFDDFIKVTTAVDAKDQRPPEGLVSAFRRPASLSIAEHITAQLARCDYSMTVVCGDLTSRGDLVGFQEACNYLADILRVKGHAISDTDLHVVPGNHDVDYRGSMPYVDLNPQRFEILRQEQAKSRLTVPLTLTTRTTQHQTGPFRLQVTSANSARGAGAQRIFPALGIEDSVGDLLITAAEQPEDAIQRYLVNELATRAAPHEVLDIPVIHPDDLKTMVNEAGELTHNGLQVFAAHHGFLPQAEPRLNAYTEMVNGGQVREALLKTRRPILYLHGHVHRDSVEVLTGGPVGSLKGGPLIVVAAPLLSTGYNEIEVEFAQDGQPLGIRIIRWRLDPYDDVVRRQGIDQTVPIVTRTSASARYRDLVRYLHEKLLVTGEDVLNFVRANPQMNVTEDDASDFMSKLVWANVVHQAEETLHDEFPRREYAFR